MDAQTDDTTLIQDTIRTYLDSMYKGSTDKVRE